MLKLFCLVFLFGILIGNLSLVKPTVATNSITDEDTIELVREKRIIKGRIANGFHRTVIVFWSELGKCTGTFLTDNLILTAAHCCENLKVNSQIDFMMITVLHAFVFERKVTITAVHISPLWGEIDAGGDLALLEMDHYFDQTESASAFGYDYKIGCGEQVYFYGHGMVDRNVPRKSNTLEMFTAKVVNCDGFKAAFPDDHLSIVGVDGAASCLGDSGGPLFNKNGQIIAVLSKGQCRGGTVSSLARVSKHKQFIQNIMARHFDNPRLE